MHWRNENGSSLIMVLIAAGVVGGIAAVLSTMQHRAFKANRRVLLNEDKTFIKHHVARNTHCKETFPLFPSASCAAGTTVEVKRERKDGTVVTYIKRNNPPTRFGKYAVKAVCNGTGTGFDVQAVRLRPGGGLTSTSDGSFYPDPLTGQIVKWGDVGSSLFASGEELCSIGNPSGLECIKVSESNPVPMPGSEYLYATCPTTHQVTGCAAACNGATEDFDLFPDVVGNRCGFGDNLCGAPGTGEIYVDALCCRLTDNP